MRRSLCLLGHLLLAVLLIGPALGSERTYSIELNSFEPSTEFENPDQWMDWGTLRMKKVGRNKYVLTGEFEVKSNMGDEQQMAMQVFRYNSDTERKGPLVMNINKPFCKFINEDEDTYPHMQKVSNLPAQGDCPFPKGEYKIDNYEMETTFLPNISPDGDYILELTVLDHNKGVAGIVAIVTLAH